jgi:hypothetical protein
VTGRCPALRFVVERTVVLTAESTRFRKGPCRDLEEGTRVKVRGHRRADGFVDANEVEFDK